MFTKICALVILAATLGTLTQLTPGFAQSYGTSNLSNTGGGGYGSAATNGASCAGYVPAGLMLNASLDTSISTAAARPGDFIQAKLTQPVYLQDGVVPAGTVLEGHVVEARAGGFLARSGRLTLKFDRLRTPNGFQAPMAAHIVGNIGKYNQIANGSETFAGENAKSKVGQTLVRTAIGAGAGAALGTAVGAIAGAGRPRVSIQPVYGPYGPYGHQMVPVGYAPQVRSGGGIGAGRGAWSGAAIGGGVGLANGLLIRNGANIAIPQGTPLQLQLDAPISINRNSQFGQG